MSSGQPPAGGFHCATTLDDPGPGIFATPSAGLSGVATAQPSGRSFTLETSNTECSTDARQYMVDHQQEIEAVPGWKVKITDPAKYAAFIDHGLKYIGNPAVCVDVRVRCK